MIRRNLLRLVYVLLLANYTLYAYWYATVWKFDTFGGLKVTGEFRLEMMLGFVGGYLTLAAPLAVLAVRPMWWGKILMLMFLLSAGLAWLDTQFVAWLGPAVPSQVAGMFPVAAKFAYAAAALAVVQQIIDPTVWRPTSTWLSKECPPPWPIGRKRSA